LKIQPCGKLPHEKWLFLRERGKEGGGKN